MLDQRPDEGFDTLIDDQGDLDPSRVLQPRGEEVHLRVGTILIRHPHFAEIVLRKLARQALESH